MARSKGRPTKCTPEVTARVVEGLERGLSIETSARLAGIGVSTYHEWVSRADEGSPFADFADAVTRALAKLEEQIIDDLKRVARGYLVESYDKDGEPVYRTAIDWRAGAWLLERKFRDSYSATSKHEHSGPDGGPLKVALEEWAKSIEEMIDNDGRM